MTSIPAFELVLTGPDGAPRQLLVDAERALVGSGAACEVRLAPEDAAPEQLWLEARGEHVFAETRAAAPPVLLDGAPFAAGRLAPGSVLAIGRMKLRVRVVERHPAAPTPAPGRALVRLCTMLGGVGIPLGILLVGPRSNAETWTWRESPPLWPAPPAAVCPPEQGAPSALGDELRRQGELARERAPFSPGDGVAAVELLTRAAACYATAGAERHAERIGAAADRLRAELERRYHVHQVRLERALVERDRARAQTETRLLLSFSAGRQSEYSDWLATLDRQMDLQLSGARR
jgi:hypothetical protein